jgi:signal transduction histidine kinase
MVWDLPAGLDSGASALRISGTVPSWPARERRYQCRRSCFFIRDFRHIRPLEEATYTGGVLPPTTRTLVLAGIASSLIAALPVWVEMARRPELVGEPRIIAWNAVFLVFLAAFLACGTMATERWPRPRHRALLLIQSLASLGMASLELSTVDAVFLVIVAAQLSEVVSLRSALVWVALQTAIYGVLLLPGRDLAQAVTIAGAFGGFQIFALYAFHIMHSERQAREELARTHESLLATRHLLAESTRAAERLRISRELHDALGHHLTALSLNLEAALHAPRPPDSRRHVETALRIARDLLAEVREVVGALRREEAEGTLAGRLAATLGGLDAGVERPLLHLTVQPDVRVDDPGLEHTLVRCAQEIFTNAVRHAGARNLWLEVAREGSGLILRARDDGRGAARVEPGNGLRGMRERVEEQGGRLDLAAAPGGGFAVTAWLPAGEGTA